MSKASTLDSLLSDFKLKLSNKQWRMENLYLILDEDGEIIPFKMRGEQAQFMADRHNRNMVPKARKLGMSTFIVIDNGDECLFRKNTRAGIIDLTEADACDKLDIFRIAWNNGPRHPDKNIAALWEWMHEACPLTTDSQKRLAWLNGSIFTAGTSYTGKTPQRLHISEYGSIAAQDPKKATRIKTGSMNSVPRDGIIDIETTMEGGRFGECYATFKEALDMEGKELTELDWRMHFFPWYNHPTYMLAGKEPQKDETREYFAKIKKDHGLDISTDRQAFWEKKRITNGDSQWQQFPTVIEECDKHSVAGQIYPEMTRLRAAGRVREFEPERGLPLVTAWDLGSSDNTAGWLIQPAGKDDNVLAWTSGEGEGAAGIAEVVRAWETTHGEISIHLVPHDANITDKGSGKTFVHWLIQCGIPQSKIVVVPRIPDKWVGIEEVRQVLPNCWFHSRADKEVITQSGAKLPSGVGRLEGYRKRPETTQGVISVEPLHDLCSHTADAFRTYAEGKSRGLLDNIMGNSAAMSPVVIKAGYKGRR